MKVTDETDIRRQTNFWHCADKGELGKGGICILEVYVYLTKEHSKQEIKMSNVDSILDNSKRFKKFRNNLIQEIPRSPNNKASLETLQSKNHTDLLIHYMCWRCRHIAVRPRKVIGLSVLEADSRANALMPSIKALIQVVEAGTDLAPYLSDRARRYGYVMSSKSNVMNSATRKDNDLLLNVTGFHHFHLGPDIQNSGLATRTNEVILAHVTRDTFNVKGLFDHSVFEWSGDDKITPERRRLWYIFDKHNAEINQDSALLMSGYNGLGISGAGTPIEITMAAIKHIEVIKNIEPKLDHPEDLKPLFGECTISTGAKLEWHYDHLDLGLLNKKSGDFYILKRGPT